LNLQDISIRINRFCETNPAGSKHKTLLPRARRWNFNILSRLSTYLYQGYCFYG